MELLYVWIDKFRNIENQGFNFSTKFYFEFEEKKKELTIKKREDIPEDFFKREGLVNITALIGENGAGKSNLLHFLGGEIYSHAEKWQKFILVWFFEGQILISSPNQGTKINKVDIPLEHRIIQHPVIIADGKVRSSEIEYLKSLSVYYLTFFVHSYLKNNKLVNDISTEHLIKKYQSINEFQRIETIERLTFIIQYQSKLKDFLPFEINTIEIDLNLPHKNEFKKLHPDTMEMIIYNNMDEYAPGEIFEMWHPIQKILALKIWNTVYNIFESELDDFKNSISRLIHIKPSENYLNFVSEELNQLSIKYCYTPLPDIKRFIEKYEKLKRKIELSSNKDDISKVLIPNKLTIKTNEVVILEELIQLLGDEYHGIASEAFSVTLPELSSGQDSFFSLVSRLSQLVQTTKESLLLIDEGDLGYHPQWQKKFFVNLLKFSSVFFKDKKIQIITTSHSPFIISDLPKQNVIFLEKDKSSGNAKVVEGISKSKTFGANIHTLFADAFFMEGGLIGEFAKEKINDIIDTLRPIITHSKSTYQAETTKVESFFQELIKAEIKEEYIQQLCTEYLDSAKTATSVKTIKQLKTWGVTGDLLKYCQDHWEEAKKYRKQLLPIYEYTKAKLSFQTEQQQKELKQIIDMIGDPVVKDKLEQMYFMALSYLNEENIQDARIKELEARAKKLGYKIIKE
jgi:energy-coupling factor transporter ATP-binding protein EcfA2